MARHGISFDDVTQAIDSILKQGETPTIARIRQSLGRGSLTTISRHFNDYKSQHCLETPEALANSYSDPVSRAVESVWQKMREEADEEIHQIKHELESQITELKQCLEEKSQCLNTLEQEHQQLGKTHEQLKNDHRQLNADYQKLHMAEQIKTEQFTSLQHQHDVVNAQQQQLINELTSQLTEEKEAFKSSQQQYQQQWQSHYKQLEKKYESQASQLQKQLNNNQLAIEELTTDLHRTQQQLNKEKIAHNFIHHLQEQTQSLTQLINTHQQSQNSEILTLHQQQRIVSQKLQDVINEQQQQNERKRFIIRKAQKKRRKA